MSPRSRSIHFIPFKNSPQPPPDFYTSSLKILIRSLQCLLPKSNLLDNDNHNISRTKLSKLSLISKEKLYKIIQNLCLHNYGPRLYEEVLLYSLKDGCYCCFQNLVMSITENLQFPKIQTMNNFTISTNKNLPNNPFSKELNKKLLKYIHSLLFEYLDYLSQICSIFLPLNQKYLYYPLCQNIIKRFNEEENDNLILWSLWDFGLHILWSQLTGNELTLATSNPHTVFILKDENYFTLEILQECIISHLKHDLDNQEEKMENLVRDCIKVFGMLDCIHCTEKNQLTESTGAKKDLLKNIEVSLIKYFTGESDIWKEKYSETSMTGQEVREFLFHVRRRCEQWNTMKKSYLLDQETSSHNKTINSLHGIIEIYLLTPHWNKNYLLNSKYLYPFLDRDSMNTVSSNNMLLEDVHILYQFSQRVFPSMIKDSDSIPIMNLEDDKVHPSGVYLLGETLREYGRKRARSILKRLQVNSKKNNSISLHDPQRCTSIIPDLLQLQSHLEKIVKKGMNNQEYFRKIVRSIWDTVFNESDDIVPDDKPDVNKPMVINNKPRNKLSLSIRNRLEKYNDPNCGGRQLGELLAKYIDTRLKDTKTICNIESFQDSIIELFRYLQSKDVFEAFYRRDLAKRLVGSKTFSMDAEKSFVTRLKLECGCGYTSKLEGMFQDIELSQDIMSKYHTSTPHNQFSSNLDMALQVLTTGYWPIYPKQNGLVLPPIIEYHKRHFEFYYKQTYQGRRIEWQHMLGTVTIKAYFPAMKGSRDLVMSFYQALVLLCFNVDNYMIYHEEQKLTIGDIMRLTGLDNRDEVERILQSLSLGKEGTRVLIKIDHNNGQSQRPMKLRRTVHLNDMFQFNKTFTSNQHRIRITNIQSKENLMERKKTHDAVSRDRLCLMDAAIVRIMKSRKIMEHRELVVEAMNQLKFPTNSTDIKKRTESLIEREYMERLEEDRNKYNYLA